MKVAHILTYVNTAVWLSLVILFIVFWASDAASIDDVTNVVCDEDRCACETQIDVIRVAVQLGRLDFVSVSLAIIGAAVAFFAIFGFLFVRERAEHVAVGAAVDTVVEKWQEWEANTLPKLVIQQMEQLKDFVGNDLSDEDADNIASQIGEDDDSKQD